MIGILAFAAAVAQPALPSIFGIQLGVSVTLPECRRIVLPYAKPGDEPLYERSQTEICQDLPNRYDIGEIRFPIATMPEILGIEFVTTQLIDGELAGIYADTLRDVSMTGIIQQLTEKFGKPTSAGSEDDLVQDVPVSVTVVRWVRPGYRIEYRSLGHTFEHGKLRVETDAALALRHEREKARAAALTPL